MAKYKAGQFVKVTVPGKYRMRRSKKGAPCLECALNEICNVTLSSIAIFNTHCINILGWHSYLEKVK